MKKLLGPALFMFAIAVASHLTVLYYAPSFIMDRAMAMLADRGSELHRFTLAERTTPQTQSVVRPSPDLAYSGCLFDMSKASSGLLVRMAKTDGYSSLSFFDASTNNFDTIRGNEQQVEVRLLPPNSPLSGAKDIIAPTNKGIILIRRLAPTAADYDKVAAIALNDECGLIAS